MLTHFICTYLPVVGMRVQFWGFTSVCQHTFCMKFGSQSPVQKTVGAHPDNRHVCVIAVRMWTHICLFADSFFACKEHLWRRDLHLNFYPQCTCTDRILCEWKRIFLPLFIVYSNYYIISVLWNQIKCILGLNVIWKVST